MFLAGGLLLIEPKLMTDIIGLALIVLGLLWQIRKRKAEAKDNMDNTAA
jgi:UPF0716 family protein affecting phage T7 exclusion